MKILIEKLFLLCLLFTLDTCFAQQEELSKFLTALQSPDEVESKKVIRDYSFNYKAEKPILDFGNIKGELLDSDTKSVQVFKGSVVCKAETGEKVMGQNLTSDKRKFFILYLDKLRQHWVVFEFRDYLEPEKEYEVSKARVDKGDFYSAKEFVYRNLAYWALMSGKVAEAQKYDKMATESAEANKNESFMTGNEKVFRAIL